MKFQKIVPLNRTFFATYRGTIFFHWLFISDYLHIKINTKSHFGAIVPLNRTILPRFRGLIVSLRLISWLSVAVNMHTDADSESNRQALHVRAVRQLQLKTNDLNQIEKYPTFSIAATAVARGCTLAGKILIIYKFLKYSFAFFVIR